MEQQVRAADVAAYLVRQCADEGSPLTQLGLQKLLALCQSLYAYEHDGHGMFPDPVEAWDKGPAVYAVWALYHGYGSDPITSAAGELRLLPDDMLSTIARVITEASHVSVGKLIRLTHEHGTWSEHHQPHGHEEIPVAELAKAWPDYHAAILSPVCEDVDPTSATYRPDERQLAAVRDVSHSKRGIHFDFAG